ncbi:LysE family transporter [Bradyrhizobium ontarionense]|uniref:LysE family transporter n=1 Tax=Bradyrhizobium ontarionense TaxID=2898149 RepID=A0ABY3R311_9BRAD|nr:LysE family transporter [Bradyrhizobium sp. A19]UFZ01685.1 LysE family transporter [Bradyrhizobium sp. A19]
MELLIFVLSAAALLATPGPTNTLLATAGASRGVRYSVHLLLAELAGYLLAILTLRVVLGPVIATAPLVGHALRVAVVLYLLHLAVALWRHGGASVVDVAPVTSRRVLITTLLNPKAIIFAFTLLPSAADAASLLPFLIALGFSTMLIGGGWLLLGATLRRGLGGLVPATLGYRCSAAALALLACVILAPALAVL